MTYLDVLEIFDKSIYSAVAQRYGMDGYSMEPVGSHEGGRNVVCICEKEQEPSRVLRVSYQNDRSEEDYLAELEFVRYLHDNGASVVNVISSKDSKLVEAIDCDGCKLFLAVFEKAPGMQLAENGYRYREGAPLTEYFYNCGKTLGKIHQLSKEYQPVHCRYHFEDKFNMEYIDALLPDSLSDVKNRISEILGDLAKIEKSTEVYGMVHFDYSDGNYHIDFENGQITVYDFDNCCHAWYIYDLAELWTHGEGWIMFEEDPEKRMRFMEDYMAEILRGYRTETSIDDEVVRMLPLFIMVNRIELLVDAFEVEHATGENYLDDEDLDMIRKCLLEGVLI